MCLKLYKTKNEIHGRNCINQSINHTIGSRMWAYFFRKMTDHVVGLDYSSSLLHSAPIQKKVLADASKTLPFKDESFDVVFCAGFLHHLDSPKFALEEMKRVSKKTIIVLEPNRNHPLLFLTGLIIREERGLLRFSKKYMENLFLSTGLRIIASASIGMCIIPIDFLSPVFLHRFNYFLEGIRIKCFGFKNIVIAIK